MNYGEVSAEFKVRMIIIGAIGVFALCNGELALGGIALAFAIGLYSMRASEASVTTTEQLDARRGGLRLGWLLVLPLAWWLASQWEHMQ